MEGGGTALEVSSSLPAAFLSNTLALLLQAPLTIPTRSSLAKIVTCLSLPTFVRLDGWSGNRDVCSGYVDLNNSRITVCFKNIFTTLKAYVNLFIGRIHCFELSHIAKHTEFYLGQLRFNVTFAGNTRCFKKSFAIVFQMLLCGECTKTFALKDIQTIHDYQ
jgi:hypothetical protein